MIQKKYIFAYSFIIVNWYINNLIHTSQKFPQNLYLKTLLVSILSIVADIDFLESDCEAHVFSSSFES